MFSIEHHKNCNLWDVMLWKSYFQLSMRGNKVVEPIILLNNYWFSVPQCSPQLCQKCNFRVSGCHLFAKEFFFVIFSISFCTIFVAQMSGSSEVALMYGPYWCFLLLFQPHTMQTWRIPTLPCQISMTMSQIWNLTIPISYNKSIRKMMMMVRFFIEWKLKCFDIFNQDV